MALSQDIQGIVQNTLKMLLDFGLGKKITYTQVSNISYDPLTGNTTPITQVHSNVVSVLLTFSAEEKTEDVVVITDRKALIAYKDLPIVISNNDYFIDPDGARWEIKKNLGFPGDPVHKLHVRKV